uniref:Uncharacterized protein n=1 Tax=Timema cristinae TaxID=61476 RepID=A0A7R9H4R1_TIMCR|nr:unnamed protein product [Timema cristinae]
MCSQGVEAKEGERGLKPGLSSQFNVDSAGTCLLELSGVERVRNEVNFDRRGPVTNISSRNVTPNSFTVTWLLQSLVAVSCEYNITTVNKLQALKRCTIPCYSRERPDVLQVCAENMDIKTRLCQDLTGGETELTMTGLDDCSRYLVTVMILTQGSNFTSSYTELTTAPSKTVNKLQALKRCTIPCYSRERPDVLQVCAENMDIKTRLCQDLTGGETELTMTGLDDCSRYLVTVMILTQGSNFTSSYTELTTAPSSNVSFTLAISP